MPTSPIASPLASGDDGGPDPGSTIGRSGWRGLVRSPFFWAALAGLVLVPAIRPLTRHVPAPPPVTGQLPPFEALDQSGRQAGSHALADHVYLIAAIPSESSERPAHSGLAALVVLQRRCARMGVRLTLVTVPRDPIRDPPATMRRAIEGAGGDLSMQAGDCGGDRSGCGTWMTLTRASPPPLPPAGRAWLVDGDGATRGDYALDEVGLDEVFHRAQHVMSLRRQWR